MRVELPSLTAWLVGDPHLGRKFETGVPLHRRGEREAMQLEKFKMELNTRDVDVVVVVGDLFDHPHVGYHVVLSAYEALRDAPNEVFVMGGNHDEPRNTSVVSAIDVLEELCTKLDHVFVVRNPQRHGALALFPWEWTRSALDQVSDFDGVQDIEAAIGHWDLISFGGDESHMAPTKALHECFGDIPIYSGHYHIEDTFPVDGVNVNCTGSLEPYSHGEDPNGERYVTLTLAELEATDHQELKDKCVRILLAEGEELPTDLDCLALTAKRQRAEEIELEDINTDQFSWKEILEKSLEDVPQHVREFIDDKMKEYEDG